MTAHEPRHCLARVKSTLISFVATCIALCQGSFALGDDNVERTVRSTDVLQLTAEHNPSLKASLIAEARADAAIRAEEGLYPYVFDADTGYTHSSTPLGESQYRKTDQVTLGAGISKTFAVGTTADFHLAGQWYRTQASSLDIAETRDVPNFGLGARLTLIQPILRGAGNRVGLASLRSAQKQKTATEKSTDAAASAVAKDVLDTYWSLWLAVKIVEINRKSRDIAAAQLEETEQRVAVGDAAEVDILAYRTRLAALEETVVAAQADVRRLQLQLAAETGLIADDAQLTADTNEAPGAPDEDRTAEEVLRDALAFSPSIQEAFAAVSLAEENLKIAGESLRQRLDFSAWVEARTLAVDELAPVVTDFGKGGAYAGYVGLTYELPLDNRRKEGKRAQARLAVEIATQNLLSAENQVRADTLAAYDDLAAAKNRLTLAEETLRLAEAQAEAERERYRLGASIFTTVRDAEETVREAELRVAKARIDIVQTQIALDHQTGVLLTRLTLRAPL